MKVSGGLIAITLNPAARKRYFLITPIRPELASMAEQAKPMPDTSSKTQTSHHTVITAVSPSS